MTIKTKFISDFIADAFKHLDINYKEIQTLYDNEKLELIEEASVSEGDSHEKSKSVIIFTFSNNIKLVYKPRDLRVIKTYNSFVDCINESSALLDVAKINGLYYENYSFEKFIKYEQCKSEQEIKNYYKRFRHIVAIAHVLCANDLHSENLIAASQYPTIIDLETIIQADSQLYISKKERAGAVIKHDMFVNSICFTSLLPQLSFNNKNGKVIGISALNGKSDKLPFKVLSPININTDEYKLDYQNHIIQASNNIPMLNGKLVYFNNYKKEIYSGFEEMMNFFMDSKSKLIGKNGKINVFKGCIVRNVLKSTQLYMNLLNYSNHPNYAQDMLSREKLIENLWSYPYKNKEVIKYEYNDMMYDDIPVFFSYTDSKNIISSTKEIIKDYFPQSGLSKVLQRIKNLDVEEIEKQKSILKVRLGQYNEVVDNLKGNMECLYKIDFNINILGEILDKSYKQGAMQISYNQKKKKWMATISFSFNLEEIKTNENLVMGIDLGVSKVATLSIYDASKYEYIKMSFKDTCIDGTELMHYRQKLESRRKALSIASKWASDNNRGHGYKTKMEKANYMGRKYNNFRDTYNHKVSRYIVDVAIKYRVGLIQMEDLSGFSEQQQESLLKNWSYYDLQQKIKYKAEENGIRVYFINPKYTSQRCSKCGNIDKENRKTQESFSCTVCNYKDNADVNASKNIAIPDIEKIIEEQVKKQY